MCIVCSIDSHSHLLLSAPVVSSNGGGDGDGDGDGGDRAGRVGVYCGENDPVCGRSSASSVSSAFISSRKLSNSAISCAGELDGAGAATATAAALVVAAAVDVLVDGAVAVAAAAGVDGPW